MTDYAYSPKEKYKAGIQHRLFSKTFTENRHTSLLNYHINNTKISILAASYVQDLQFYSYLEQISRKPK